MRQCLGIPPALRLSGPFASIGLTQRTLLGRLPPAASGQETPIVQGRCRQRRPRVQSRRCAEALPHLPTATCCPNARPHAGVRPPLEASLAPLLRPSGVVRGTPHSTTSQPHVRAPRRVGQRASSHALRYARCVAETALVWESSMEMHLPTSEASVVLLATRLESGWGSCSRMHVCCLSAS